MSHRNYRRPNRPRKDSSRYKGSPLGGDGRVSTYADKAIGAQWGGDNSHGHQGYARAKAGAKHFIRARIRFAEKQQLTTDLMRLV